MKRLNLRNSENNKGEDNSRKNIWNNEKASS